MYALALDMAAAAPVLEVLRAGHPGVDFTVRDGLFRARLAGDELAEDTPGALVRAIGAVRGPR